MIFVNPSLKNRHSCVYRSTCYITLVINITFCLLLSFKSLADDRPKIGVAFGGGGSKGAAHIGVLKALEEMHIPVDYIAGTSMGAYVGGLYATGMSADEIEAFIDTVDWSSGYQDRVERSDRRVREKQQEDRFQIKTDIGFGLWELKMPKGFVQGQKMGEILRSTSGGLPKFESFDQLAIPFRAVASDIESLQPVILARGDLAEAMQASMSIPGILPPMALNDQLLVDGGITNNLPISVVKEMGADIIIAVDISNDFKRRDELNNYFAVMDQLTDFMVRNNVTQQIALLSERDFLIRPDTQGIKTIDFQRMPEAYEIGYNTTMAMKEQLSQLGSSVTYQTYIDNKQHRRRQLKHFDKLRVDEIRLANYSQYSDEALLKRLDLESGATISAEQLADSVRNLYALDRFERIDYSIEQEHGKNVVALDVQEKSWGPNFVDLRFALEDDFKNTTDYSIGVAFNVTGLSDAGAEWRTELEFGTDKRAATEMYLPFISDQEWFALLGAEYEISHKNLALNEAEPLLADIDDFISAKYVKTALDASLGWQPELWQEVRLGYRYIDGDVTFPGFFGELLGTLSRSSNVGYISYNLDTLDDYSLPSYGNLLKVEFAVSDDNVEYFGESISDIAFLAEARWKGAYTYQRHTVMGKAEYGRVKSDEDLQLEPAELGGFLHLSGIPKNSLAGNNKIFSAAIYRYRLMDNDFGLFKSPVYIGGSVEWGGVFNDNSLPFAEVPKYWAGSIFSGIKTPAGPLILAYGRTEENFDSFYLFLGGAF